MPAALAFAFLDQLQLVAVALGPAHVHAKQHRGPVLAFGAAGAGMDFEIGVVAVRLARQHGLQPQLLGALLQAPIARFSASATMAASFFGFRHLDQAGGVGQFIFQRADAPTATCRASGARASASARPAGSFQRAGSSALAFSSSRRRSGLDPSQRCLLSRAMACWMSSTLRWVSGRMSRI